MERQENKILFIEPPFYRLFKNTYSLDRYSLSLGYLTGAVRKNTDWEVAGYNADFFAQSELLEVSYLAGAGFDSYLLNLKDSSAAIWKEIKTVILEYKPAVVGISAKSQNFTSACIVAKLVKEIDSKIIVIIGGPHPSMVGAEVLKFPEVDLAVIGEGEVTIVELLKAIALKEKFDSIKGLIYRKNDLIVQNPRRDYIDNLDSLAFPYDYARETLINFAQYPKAAFGYIFATRGCPYNCFFCGSRNIWSRAVRFRTPENVTEEIKKLQNEGIRLFHFVDDNFGVNYGYILDLCQRLIKHCPGIKWDCELHVNLVEDETVFLMKKAGCYFIQIGIESGNNEILKQMRKNITIEKAYAAARIIKKQGILLQAFFIIGFPQETEASLQDTIKAMRKINCDVLTYNVFTPYPGTESFKFCQEKGVIGENYDIALYNHQSPANYFCMYIHKDRFRMLALKIEKMVDRKNKISRIKRIFSSTTFDIIKEIGISKSIKKGLKVFMGK
jgi:anaerobic magnesium-protoporphyrin IX monomethyl ester cyclase